MSKIQMWLCLSAAAVVSLIAAVFFINHAAYSRGYNAAMVKVEKQAQVTKEKQQTAATQASKGYQTEKAAADKEAEIRYVEVEKIIERPVYINECFDASGVQLINQAVGQYCAARGLGRIVPTVAPTHRRYRKSGAAVGVESSGSIQRLCEAA